MGLANGWIDRTAGTVQYKAPDIITWLIELRIFIYSRKDAKALRKIKLSLNHTLPALCPEPCALCLRLFYCSIIELFDYNRIYCIYLHIVRL